MVIAMNLVEDIKKKKKQHNDKALAQIVSPQDKDEKGKVEKYPGVLLPRKSKDMKNLEEFYGKLVSDCTSMPVNTWLKKEVAMMNEFIVRFNGINDAMLVMKYIFENWEDLKETWRISGNMVIPSVRIISSYSDENIYVKANMKANPAPKRERCNKKSRGNVKQFNTVTDLLLEMEDTRRESENSAPISISEEKYIKGIFKRIKGFE